MSRFSSGAESEEEAFTVGTPTLSEIKEYFSVHQYYTAESGTDSNSSGELSESFAELLEKRRQESKEETIMSGSLRSSKYATKRIQQVIESVESEHGEELPSSQEEGLSMWNAGTDESFLAAEKVCEKTVDYNYHYMGKIQSVESPKSAFSNLREDVEDETILNDVEPPSMLCEQTIIRGTPGKNPYVNCPSTILEESTLATSDCSFYTAELAKTARSEETGSSALDDTDETLSEKVEVIELSDESSGASGVERSEISETSQTTDSHPSSSQTSQTEHTDDSSFSMSREFNDSLERVEYLMKQGEKYRKKMGLQPQQTKTPPPTANSSSLGAIPKSNNAFKQPRVPSKIPQIRAKKYDHIKSPISAYIHKTPSVPQFIVNRLDVQQKYEKTSKAANSSPQFRSVGEKENIEVKLSPKMKTLPKKACIQAAFAKVHDERVNPVAAGPKMLKLIGDSVDPEKTPGVTRHVCRYKTARLPPDVVEQERKKMSLIAEDSIGDLSVMSGDVSVQVVKNAIKF
ncbi:uncharacterized protein LOC129789659 [Lutzomyia longipalpis]|uniref:uncharacterized protein LOC129789659 n=1 Tax=Lutzomyia longipalpis TaxID=7200 RepID=UPI0024840809|nr:uncharacterized protein LOC129789659 [Lutzomyia longipalpis]